MLTGAGVHIDSGEVSICGRRVHSRKNQKANSDEIDKITYRDIHAMKMYLYKLYQLFL